jgi:2-dehydropantoate 2-reductase
VETRIGGSEADVLWEKLARQAPLAALTSVTGRPTGEVRDDPRLRAAVEEACAVAAADGARTTFADQWSIIESLPAELTTSTARDVAAGRPSELDAVAGGVVRAGRRLGVPTPTFEELLELCPA